MSKQPRNCDGVVGGVNGMEIKGCFGNTLKWEELTVSHFHLNFSFFSM